MLVTSWFDRQKRGCVVGISLSVPRGAQYTKLWPNLYPSPELLGDWKRGRISWAQYRERYLDLLRSRWSSGLKEEIMALDNDVTLCCWEHTPEMCHRSIVAEVIAKVRPGLEVEVR
jgi:uncharacterized protein YeaO (DUF488 family)